MQTKLSGHTALQLPFGWSVQSKLILITPQTVTVTGVANRKKKKKRHLGDNEGSILLQKYTQGQAAG